MLLKEIGQHGQRLALNAVLDYIRRNPIGWAADKTVRFWKNIAQVHTEAFRRIERNIYGEIVPRYTGLIVWGTALAFLLFSIGWMVGLISAPASPGHNLLLLWLSYSAAVYIVVALLLRTRPTLFAILALFAGCFWGQILEALHQMRTRPLAALSASILLVLLLANLDVYRLPGLWKPVSAISSCK